MSHAHQRGSIHGFAYLMDVVMDVLRCSHRHNFACALALDPLDLVTELGLLGIETKLDLVVVLVFEGALLQRENVAFVVLVKSLRISNWLDGGMEVIDVAFAVDHGDDFLLLIPRDDLVVNSRSDGLVNAGVVMAIFAPRYG